MFARRVEESTVLCACGLRERDMLHTWQKEKVQTQKIKLLDRKKQRSDLRLKKQRSLRSRRKNNKKGTMSLFCLYSFDILKLYETII